MALLARAIKAQTVEKKNITVFSLAGPPHRSVDSASKWDWRPGGRALGACHPVALALLRLGQLAIVIEQKQPCGTSLGIRWGGADEYPGPFAQGCHKWVGLPGYCQRPPVPPGGDLSEGVLVSARVGRHSSTRKEAREAR